jgi:hypothetical protein
MWLSWFTLKFPWLEIFHLLMDAERSQRRPVTESRTTCKRFSTVAPSRLTWGTTSLRNCVSERNRRRDEIPALNRHAVAPGLAIDVRCEICIKQLKFKDLFIDAHSIRFIRYMHPLYTITLAWSFVSKLIAKFKIMKWAEINKPTLLSPQMPLQTSPWSGATYRCVWRHAYQFVHDVIIPWRHTHVPGPVSSFLCH